MHEIFYRWLKFNGIFFGVLLVLGGGLLFFLQGDIMSRVSTLVHERTLLVSRSQGIAALATLREESKRGASYVASLNEVLPKRDELFSFSRAVDAAARNRKINLNFAFGTESSGSGAAPSSIGFTMSTSGEYDKTIHFLKDIETRKFLVTFSSFDITQIAPNTYNAHIAGQVFFRS